MRIGVFGGTFDPVHAGHLILAESCREAARLDEVWFVPSHSPPHKLGVPVSRFDARLDMVGLAITGQPAFRVDPIERDLPAPSYTANTLAALRAKHPAHTLVLLVGSDVLPDLATWHRPADVLDAAELAVVARPGVSVLSADQVAASVGVSAERVRLTPVESPLVAISSRDLRARFAAGRTVRFLLPRAVEEYARERNLYRG